MKTAQSGIKWKCVFLTVLVLVFIPFPSHMIPVWTIQVVDRQNQPLSNVNAEQSWKHYSYFMTEGFDAKRSDANRNVVFPSRRLWASAFSRVVSPALAEIGTLAHGSTGLSINARIYDEVYYGEDLISWYSNWHHDKPLPNKIVAVQKQKDD
jgi:hypothetical protein